MLLTINNLDVTLGGLQILQDVSLHVDEGELVVVVGGRRTNRPCCAASPA
ncbi:MAG: hypothetical protein ACLVL7_02410 [Anaerotruncus massiliensis (ex Togo et al. 2019)]